MRRDGRRRLRLTLHDRLRFDSSDSVRGAAPLRHARPVTFAEPLRARARRRAAGGHRRLRDLRPAERRRATTPCSICHAISGDSHVARHDAADDPGWWDIVVGPGQADRHRPLLRHLPEHARRLPRHDRARTASTRAPAGPTAPTSRPSPSATWSRSQRRLVDHLGIDVLLAVVGGSLGGHQALTWAHALPGARCAAAWRWPRRRA